MSPSPLALRAEIAALLPRLRRFARAITPHREDADDLVLSAVARALNHLDQRPDGTRLDGWLFRTMKNAWIDDARARGQRDGELALEVADEHVDDRATSGRSAPLSIDAAMAHLPDDQRLAVGLVLVEGLPYTQAAGVLEIPIATLTSDLAQGRHALQRLLGQAGPAS
jgi:RNA polymerase sigma factor (sigma-70 family)